MTLICEESIARVNPQQSEIVTPTDTKYMGIDANQSQIVGVSVIRAGDSMLDVFLNISPESSAGKILIQRDEATALPVLFYSKVPPLAGKSIILLDPVRPPVTPHTLSHSLTMSNVSFEYSDVYSPTSTTL